jgi:hypothetical protein
MLQIQKFDLTKTCNKCSKVLASTNFFINIDQQLVLSDTCNKCFQLSLKKTSTCARCSTEKNIDLFYVSKKGIVDCWCKDCKKEYAKKYAKTYFQNNKQKLYKYRTNWARNNDKVKKYQKEYGKNRTRKNTHTTDTDIT